MNDIGANDELDPAMFNASAPKSQGRTQFARVRRAVRPKFVKFHRAQNLVDAIGPISEGECIFALISGDFIAGDIVEAFLVKHQLRAETLILATLTYSQENIDSLVNLKTNGYVGDLGVICSDYFFSHHRKTLVEYAIDKLSPFHSELFNERFTFATAGIHTKITLIRTTCGKHIVIHGSANLRSSRNVEQLVFECNQDLYEFNLSWMQKILTRYQASHKMLTRVDWRQAINETHKTEGKGLRAAKLWEIVK